MSIIPTGWRQPNGFYVYAFYQPEFAEPIYIGKGKDDRALMHFVPSQLKQNIYFHNKLRGMLSEGYIPEIIFQDEDLTESDALALERRLIQYFGRKDIGTGCLYNTTDGGEGTAGYRHTLEARIKISEAGIGRIRGLETRQKLSDANKGSYNYHFWKPVAQMLCGQVLKTYPSIQHVADDGFVPKKVSDVLHGRRTNHQGFDWEFVNA